MKKILVLFAVLTMTLTASAQFESGKKYLEASVNNIGLSYNGAQELRFGLAVKGGVFIDDCWLLDAQVGYTHQYINQNSCVLGVGTRYYILQNGIYGAFNVKAVFESHHNDVMPGVEVGYSFFINDKVTIEPAVYYDQSFSDHRNYSTVGLKVGLGIYF